MACRENAIRLEENEKREKELRNKIIEEAIDFKNAFYEKRKLQIDAKRDTNREKEKVEVMELVIVFLHNLFLTLSSSTKVI